MPVRTFAGWSTVVVLWVVTSFVSPFAFAEEEDSRSRTDRIIEGLEHGVQALRALDGQEDLVARLEALLAELRVKAARKELDQERATARRWLELFHMAHDVLQDARREEHAEVAKRARDWLQVMVEGRTDDEARRIREARPSRAQQAHALLLAAEILSDQGKRDRAKMLVELGRSLKDRSPQGEAERDDRRAYLEGLRRRVAAMRQARTAFREAERQELVQQIDKAIRTGELLLEGRDDDEAQAVYEQTPDLGQLAELLGHAAHLWKKFGDAKRATECEEVSQHYAQRWRAERKEREAAERARAQEREAKEREREADERERVMKRLQKQLRQMYEHLEDITRQLEALRAGDR